MHFSIRNGDFATLRHDLEEFGYLFIRGFHPDNLIKIARKGKDFSLFFKITKKGLIQSKNPSRNLKNVLDTLKNIVDF